MLDNQFVLIDREFQFNQVNNMRRGRRVNQHQHGLEENIYEDILSDQVLLHPSFITLQNQVNSLTSQVRVLKRIAMRSLFESREEMLEFVDDIW
jgi:hypothetical protein